jgi:hypothetical protein
MHAGSKVTVGLELMGVGIEISSQAGEPVEAVTYLEQFHGV